MKQPLTLSAFAAVIGLAVSILLGLNLLESRASRYAIAVRRIETIESCQGDQEARLRTLERAYNQQVPILTALAEHFQLSLPPP